MKRTLTGRTRTREQFRLFGKNKLILQVEVSVKGVQNNYDPTDPLFIGEDIEIDYTEWRDATLDDVSTIKSG